MNVKIHNKTCKISGTTFQEPFQVSQPSDPVPPSSPPWDKGLCLQGCHLGSAVRAHCREVAHRRRSLWPGALPGALSPNCSCTVCSKFICKKDNSCHRKANILGGFTLFTAKPNPSIQQQGIKGEKYSSSPNEKNGFNKI